MKRPECAVYELIPPQEMIQFMLKYSFFHKQVTQIPESIIVNKDIDFDLMEKAFNIEIERNDCLRLRFFKEKGRIRQYFLPEYKIGNIPVLNFKSEQERIDILTADARKPIKMLKGETFRVKFFRTHDNRCGVYVNIHHLVMDNAAVFTFFADLFAVYDSLSEGASMPRPLGKYEDIIKKELAYVADPENFRREEKAYREFMEKDGEPLYLGVEGPKFLEAERIKRKNPDIKAPSLFDPIHDKAELTKYSIPYDDSQKIFKFMEENGVSGECLVQLGMRLHVSKINNRHNDTYFIVLCPRRRTLAEKRAGGTLAAPLPQRIVLPENTTFREALEKMAEVQFWAFRHMDYPYLEYRALQQKMYNYPAAAGASTMMFSWFPLEAGSMNKWEYEFEGYSLGRYIMVLYSFAMKDTHSGCLKLSCMHRTKFVSVEDIDSFHKGTANALKLGVENPDMTLGEIMDRI
ncbi:MAG: condensation domain-containing protein [Acutalibacteraceae bacterium]|nr:condensation domain-containing protein [Acutalibacteraceae bacterium]